MNKEKVLNFLDKQIKDTEHNVKEAISDYECEPDIHKGLDMYIQAEKLKSSKCTLQTIRNFIADDRI